MKELNQTQKEALVLFRDRSLLELKSFLTEKSNELNDGELEILETAIEFHRNYNRIKLTQKKNKNESAISLQEKNR